MKRCHVRAHGGLVVFLLLCLFAQAPSSSLAQDATPTTSTQAGVMETGLTQQIMPTSTPEPSAEPASGDTATTVPSELPATSTIVPNEQAAIADGTPGPADATETPEPESLSIMAAEAITVSPEDPVIVQATCIGGMMHPPTVSFAETPGITYQTSDTPMAGDSYSLIATPNVESVWGPLPEGWVLVFDNQAAFKSFELDPEPSCSDVVPISPTVTQASCTGGTFAPPAVTPPVNTAMISYTQTGQAAVGRSIIVTADLVRDGDAWAASLPAGWTLQGAFAIYLAGPFAKAECTPNSPIVVMATCIGGIATPYSVTLAPNTNVISYQSQTGKGRVGIFATLQTDRAAWSGTLPDGWVLADSRLAYLEVDGLDDNPCKPTNLAAPGVFHAMVLDTYDEGDVIALTPIIPASPGIDYELTGVVNPNGIITVTANLQDGYDWPDDLPPGWSMIDADTATHAFVLDAELEIVTSPAAPLVRQASCDDTNPVVTIADTAGITYATTGETVAGGGVSVSATLDTGYDWAETLPAGWSLDDDHRALYAVALDSVDCDQDPMPLDSAPPASTALVSSLPSTGSGSTGAMSLPWMAIAALMCVMGGMTIRRRHIRSLD